MGGNNPTGINFGDYKYTITSGTYGGKSGWNVMLDNGVSLFVPKDNAQKGATIVTSNKEGTYFTNRMTFSNFNGVSVFGSKEARDYLEFNKSENVFVDVSNDKKGDYVVFNDDKNNHNAMRGSHNDLVKATKGNHELYSGDKPKVFSEDESPHYLR